MWNRIVKEAPPEFDQHFLLWARQLEDLLFVKLADWSPSTAEEVQRYAESIDQPIPEEMRLYYANAYPFGLLRDGWRKWRMRKEKYQALWVHSVIDTLNVEPSKAESLVNSSPPLWPVYCLEKTHDVVGFVWRNNHIAVIELDPLKGGEGHPYAIGLRNYFLANILIELLAEDKTEVDFRKLREQREVRKVSGWPEKPPVPEHIALTLGIPQR